MGADRAGRRKLRFQHSGPLDRGGTGTAFAPGGFVVWNLEERRLQPRTCLLADDGAMIIVQSTENEFYIAGTGLTVSLFRNPDVDSPGGPNRKHRRGQPLERQLQHAAAVQRRPGESRAAAINVGPPSAGVSGTSLRNIQERANSLTAGCNRAPVRTQPWILVFAACAERQSRRENLQEEALSSPRGPFSQSNRLFGFALHSVCVETWGAACADGTTKCPVPLSS